MNRDIWSLILYGTTLTSASFIAFAKDIADKHQHFKFLGWISTRVVLAIFVTLITIYATERKEAIAAKSSADEKKRSDLNLDISNKESQRVIAEALGKYGFKLDSTQKNLVKIIKDVPKSTTYNYGKDPYIGISNDSPMKVEERFDIAIINTYFYVFTLTLQNTNAPSRRVKVIVYYVTYNSKNEWRLFDTREASLDGLAEGTKVTISSIYEGTEPPGNIYFLLDISYFNSDLTKPFHVNQLYRYSINRKELYSASSKFEKKVRTFLRSKGIK